MDAQSHARKEIIEEEPHYFIIHSIEYYHIISVGACFGISYKDGGIPTYVGIPQSTVKGH